MIKVSIIMPVYNSGNYLKTAVDSILNQSFKDIELILVDDGSTDGSSERCDEYARQDNRVVVIHQKNGGICNARNAALKIARGEYIGFSDHDDEFLPGLLEDNYTYAKENGLDFVKFCKKWVFIENGKIVAEKHNEHPKCILMREDVPAHLFELMDKRFLSCVWDAFFRTDFLRQHHILFDPFFKMGGEDYDFVFQCLRHVQKMGINDGIYYFHFIRKNFSTSSKPNPQAVGYQKRFIDNFFAILDAYKIDVNKCQLKYAYFYTKFYLSPSVQAIMKLDTSFKEKGKMLDDLKLEPYYHNFLENNLLTVCRHRFYYFIWMLYKHRAYRLLFYLYKRLK